MISASGGAIHGAKWVWTDEIALAIAGLTGFPEVEDVMYSIAGCCTDIWVPRVPEIIGPRESWMPEAIVMPTLSTESAIFLFKAELLASGICVASIPTIKISNKIGLFVPACDLSVCRKTIWHGWLVLDHEVDLSKMRIVVWIWAIRFIKCTKSLVLEPWFRIRIPSTEADPAAPLGGYAEHQTVWLIWALVGAFLRIFYGWKCLVFPSAKSGTIPFICGTAGSLKVGLSFTNIDVDTIYAC